MSNEMEMPCPCDCGEWFDLNDGYKTKKYGDSTVICPSCHRKEEEAETVIEVLEGKQYERYNILRQKKIDRLKDELYY